MNKKWQFIYIYIFIVVVVVRHWIKWKRGCILNPVNSSEAEESSDMQQTPKASVLYLLRQFIFQVTCSALILAYFLIRSAAVYHSLLSSEEILQLYVRVTESWIQLTESVWYVSSIIGWGHWLWSRNCTMPAEYLWAGSQCVFIPDLECLEAQTNFVNLAVKWSQDDKDDATISE